jgi:hypothetical protein
LLSGGLYAWEYYGDIKSNGGTMKYRVHRLEAKKEVAQEKLEYFLNQLEGQVLTVIPYVTPTFQLMGATSKVDFFLIVEQVD